MSDPEEIYLAPKCCLDPEMGRCWAADDEWPIEPGDENNGHEPATRYVRADLAHAEIMKLREALREALHYFEFYGCPICGGDCPPTNPPVTVCPIHAARAALPKTEADHD